MQTLKGNLVKLRALEPEDLQFIFDTENDENHWEVSATQAPYSKYILKNYLKNTHLDIYEVKQQRLVIADLISDQPVGMIDLFEFDPQHKRAGIGILILGKHQGKGFAKESLKLVISYSFHYLNLHQLFANITTDNHKSISLFEKLSFTCAGIKKDWIYSNQEYKDEALYQLIHKIEG
jgi:diamine N-acetyltransferase